MKTRLILFYVSFLSLSTNVHAGIPVFDGVGLMQNINQVLGLAQQLDQLEQEYNEMRDQGNKLQNQINSVTGSRGLGNIYNDPDLKNTVPSNAMAVFSDVARDGSGLTPQAQAIRNSSREYDCNNLTGASQQSCRATLNLNAQKQAYTQNALDLVSQRVNQIQAIQDRISYTSDPKEIAELQARLQAENTQVANNANQIQVMELAAKAQEEAIRQQRRERTLKWLSQTGDGSAGYSFPTSF